MALQLKRKRSRSSSRGCARRTGIASRGRSGSHRAVDSRRTESRRYHGCKLP